MLPQFSALAYHCTALIRNMIAPRPLGRNSGKWRITLAHINIMGAFIFGIGMQLGGGCASGTLYTVGGGSTRMIVTLLAFIGGSLIGTAHMPFWTSLPQMAPISLRSLLAALVGGLLLGYGARLAYGCNIGAYFSGIISGSLHGWLWLVAAFIGNVFGTRLRPLFGLEVERVKPTAC